MSWHIIGTCLAGMPTTALVPHSIGATITLVRHLPVKSFLYHRVVLIPLLIKCPNFLKVEGTFSILLMHPSVLSNQQGDRLLYTPGSCSS